MSHPPGSALSSRSCDRETSRGSAGTLLRRLCLAALVMASPALAGETRSVGEAPKEPAEPAGRSGAGEPALAPAGIETEGSEEARSLEPVGITEGVDEDAPTLDEVERPKVFTLGGGYLQRLEVTGLSDAERLTLLASPPSLVDLFLDVQPTPEFRGYLLSRLAFDPTAIGNTLPQLLIDQLWFRYELSNRVFFIVGRQQLKWGSGRVWRPTDFIRKANPTPLEVFDLRTGTDMVRIQIPFDGAIDANLHVIGLVDNQGPASDPLRYGTALRGELAFGFGEASVSAVFMQQRRPRYGVDVNFGLGPLDIYGEVALLQDSPWRLWQRAGDGTFEARSLQGRAIQATAGAWTRLRVADVYAIILRLEVLHNDLGYPEREYLTWLVSSGDYQPLYFGRRYVAFQVLTTMRSPYEPWLDLSTLVNLDDRSAFSRLDGRLLVNAGINVGAFVEVPWGERGGEFRFVPDRSIAEVPFPGLVTFRVGAYGKVQF